MNQTVEQPFLRSMIRMEIPFTGGCACGAIRYECSAEPIMMFKCHCRDCQQVTGGGFVAGLLVPASAFRLTKGQLRYSSHRARRAANTSAASALNATRELRRAMR